MISSRTIELLQHPENISSADLSKLSEEIAEYPYIQSIRALFLFGTSLYDKENYSEVLSSTAAYTTDKKILYHFINKEKAPVKEIVSNETYENPVTQAADIFTEAEQAEDFTRDLVVDDDHFSSEKKEIENPSENSFEEVGKLQSDTEVSEKNDDFDEIPEAETFSKVEVVSEDSPLKEESEVEKASEISFQEVDAFLPHQENGMENFSETPDAESFTKEEVISEETPKQEERKVDNSADISFHGINDFLPEAEVVPVLSKDAVSELKVNSSNKHIDEMQKLIAEVEARMKEKKKENISEEKEEDHTDSHEINFFPDHSVEEEKKETKVSKEKESVPKTEEKREQKMENTSWKPMDFSVNKPDALIVLETETEKKSESKPILKSAEPVKTPEVFQEKEERPVLNVSFLSENLSPILPETEIKAEKNIQEEPKPKEELKSVSESNIPQFINTWQNWLKIEKKPVKSELKEVIDTEENNEPETISENKDEMKNQAIETFIETNPKISKLKDDSDYVVKDRGDNISHLMTETLASLYVTQRLYNKAISAYGILKEKHPEKKEYFEKKIQEVKAIKGSK